MKAKAVELADRALDECESLFEIAKYFRENFEILYGCCWQCITCFENNASLLIRYKPSHMMQLKRGYVHFILYQTVMVSCDQLN